MLLALLHSLGRDALDYGVKVELSLSGLDHFRWARQGQSHQIEGALRLVVAAMTLVIREKLPDFSSKEGGTLFVPLYRKIAPEHSRSFSDDQAFIYRVLPSDANVGEHPETSLPA